MLLNFQLFGNFPESFVSLIFTLVVIREYFLYDISSLKFIKRLVLWLSIQPALVNIPCVLEKVNTKLNKCQLCSINLSYSIDLRDFLPIFLLIAKRGVLKSFILTVGIFIFPFCFTRFCSIYFEALILDSRMASSW